MQEEDYIKRLIKAISEMIVGISYGKDSVKSNIKFQNNDAVISEDGLLKIMIRKYIIEGKLTEAENRIFDAMESNNSKQYYDVALWFYKELNKWNEDKLLRCNFSKQKVIKGLENIKKYMKD